MEQLSLLGLERLYGPAEVSSTGFVVFVSSDFESPRLTRGYFSQAANRYASLAKCSSMNLCENSAGSTDRQIDSLHPLMESFR